MLERALAIKERVYGRDHPEVAIRLEPRLRVQFARRPRKARDMLRARARDLERVYGRDHPGVAPR